MAAFEFDARGLVSACDACGQKNRLIYEQLDRTVRCASCKRELPPPATPVDVPTTADFDRLIAHAPIPVVVDYWAPWCGPCRIVAPELAKVAARTAGRFLVVKVNTDVLDDLGARFGIRSIPTLAVFVGGREAARTVGVRPASDIEAFIDHAASASRTS